MVPIGQSEQRFLLPQPQETQAVQQEKKPQIGPEMLARGTNENPKDKKTDSDGTTKEIQIPRDKELASSDEPNEKSIEFLDGKSSKSQWTN